MVSGADSRRHGRGHHGPAARLPDDERSSNTYCQVRGLNFCFQKMISDDFTVGAGMPVMEGRICTVSTSTEASSVPQDVLLPALHVCKAPKERQTELHHGLTPRRHGNSCRMPATSLSFSDNEHMVTFITNYAETHAILLPGRVPG